jgi:hypothetical protein
MRIRTTLNQVLLAGSVCVTAFVSPQANAANLILNGGFEDGVHSVTLNGNTNSNVPNDWVPNAAFVQFSASNGVVSNPVLSGNASLSIGSPDNQFPPAELTQTFADVAGATYIATFSYEGVAPVGTGDPNAVFSFI